jgi:hypothetical protein
MIIREMGEEEIREEVGMRKGNERFEEWILQRIEKEIIGNG